MPRILLDVAEVVAVDQYSCASVWRATPLEFRDIWQSRATWKEDVCF